MSHSETMTCEGEIMHNPNPATPSPVMQFHIVTDEECAQKVLVTLDLLEAGKSRNGQWNDDQLACLGVPMPKKAGWIRRLIGTVVRRDQCIRFLALKDAHLRRQKAGRTVH
jgi:hypothetical protein